MIHAQQFKICALRVDMVADVVIKTIEDDTLAGKVVTVTQQSGAKTYEFPKAKF